MQNIYSLLSSLAFNSDILLLILFAAPSMFKILSVALRTYSSSILALVISLDSLTSFNFNSILSTHHFSCPAVIKLLLTLVFSVLLTISIDLAECSLFIK